MPQTEYVIRIESIFDTVEYAVRKVRQSLQTGTASPNPVLNADRMLSHSSRFQLFAYSSGFLGLIADVLSRSNNSPEFAVDLSDRFYANFPVLFQKRPSW